MGSQTKEDRERVRGPDREREGTRRAEKRGEPRESWKGGREQEKQGVSKLYNSS